MRTMLTRKSARVCAAMAAFCALAGGGTSGYAQTYVPLPDDVRDELIKLGVEDPFSIYAVDINGDLVTLVPSDVTVEPVTFPVRIEELLGEPLDLTVIRLKASESVLTCRVPPKAGDPPCSKQTKN
jgi:hypothetical protein